MLSLHASHEIARIHWQQLRTRVFSQHLLGHHHLPLTVAPSTALPYPLRPYS